MSKPSEKLKAKMRYYIENFGIEIESGTVLCFFYNFYSIVEYNGIDDLYNLLIAGNTIEKNENVNKLSDYFREMFVLPSYYLGHFKSFKRAKVSIQEFKYCEYNELNGDLKETELYCKKGSETIDWFNSQCREYKKKLIGKTSETSHVYQVNIENKSNANLDQLAQNEIKNLFRHAEAAALSADKIKADFTFSVSLKH